MGTRMLCIMLLAAMLPVRADEHVISADQAERIINELSQIRGLLSKQLGISVTDRNGKWPVARLELRGERLGSSNAPLTIVEFSDYQCSYCKRFYDETFTKMKGEYIDTGKVIFYVRDYPVSTHEHAMEAAQIARCAAEQKQFWPMDEWLRVNTTSGLRRDTVNDRVVALGMKDEQFRNCLATEKYRDAILEDIVEARRIGIRGTPAFIIGRSRPDNLVIGEVVTGAISYEALQQKLQDLLAQH